MTAIDNNNTTKTTTNSDTPPTIDDSLLAQAHVRFTQSVTKGILTLQHDCGYSRERAITTLLRELSKQNDSAVHSPSPTDDEIFRAMNLYGMGMEDAAHALTVSRAVGRLVSERGLSAAQAIDDLASKLSIARLLESSDTSSKEEERPASPRGGGGVKRPLSIESSSATPRIASPTNNNGGDNITSSRVAVMASSKVSPPPGNKKTHHNVNNKPAHKKLKTSSSHASSRKRPIDENKNVTTTTTTTRARADSVSEEVQAKVAKKARRGEDGSSSPVANSNNSPGDSSWAKRARRSNDVAADSSPNPAEV